MHLAYIQTYNAMPPSTLSLVLLFEQLGDCGQLNIRRPLINLSNHRVAVVLQRAATLVHFLPLAIKKG